MLQFLLPKGFNVNEDNEGGDTALMLAAQYADTTVVRFLLDHGANPNLSTGWQGPALMWALEDNRIDNASLLLARCAQVNVRNPDGGETALMRAVVAGDEGFVRKLLRRGAQVNARDQNGWTALDYAYQDDNDDMFDLLKQHGAYRGAYTGPPNKEE